MTATYLLIFVVSHHNILVIVFNVRGRKHYGISVRGVLVYWWQHQLQLEDLTSLR